MGATEQQERQLHEQGTFIGSVKIEVWRSHVAVTLRELLPQCKSAGWQTRVVDIYAADSSAPTVLWELCLEAATDSAALQPTSVELRYESKTILLAIRNQKKKEWLEGFHSDFADERIVFCVPLDAEQLAQFNVPETDSESNGVAGNANAFSLEADERAAARIASFAHQDERQGVDWQLRIRDFHGRTPSGRWTIVEPSKVRRVS